jgi:hypothetical protein
MVLDCPTSIEQADGTIPLHPLLPPRGLPMGVGGATTAAS